MSRIGKKPIPLPSGVKITVGEQLEVTGPKGKLMVPIPDGINRVRPTFGPLVVGMIQVQSDQSPNEGNEGTDAQTQETPSLSA